MAERLDPETLVSVDGNRWSSAGEPTIYVARDPGVAIAEYGRHRTDDDTAACVWTMRVTLDAAIDLRDPGAWSDPRGTVDPALFLDRDLCRLVADQIRRDGRFDGILVPSVAFLDDFARPNLVVFVERLRRSVPEAIEIIGRTHAITPHATGRRRIEAG